jgi:hypothetical protein
MHAAANQTRRIAIGPGKARRAPQAVHPLCVSVPFLLVKRVGHLFDCGFSSLFLRDALVLSALARRDLADQPQIASLELARSELLGRYGAAATAPL